MIYRLSWTYPFRNLYLPNPHRQIRHPLIWILSYLISYLWNRDSVRLLQVLQAFLRQIHLLHHPKICHPWNL